MLTKKKNIPKLPFRSQNERIEGVEIISLSDLKQRRLQFNHDPESPHQLAFYMLIYYTAGKSKQLVDFVWYEVEAGTLLYLSKGQVNSYRFTEDLEGYIVLFTEDYFQKQLNKLPNETIIQSFTSHLFSPKIQVPERSEIAQYLSLFHHEFYETTQTPTKADVLAHLFTILFLKLEELKIPQDLKVSESNQLERFLKFKSVLETHFQTSRNADFYADKLHVSYKHLNAICKAIVNKTAKQFIDEFLILSAKRQLINSDIKSKELSFIMGFKDPNNFVKYFRKHTGLTPKSFKSQYS